MDAVTPTSARSPRSALAAALLGPLCLIGCHALPEMDFNPIIRVEHTADGAVEVEAIGPLIDVRDGPEGLSHAFRPFYQHKANFGLSVTDWLAPFGRNFDTHGGSRMRFWPLIWSASTQIDDEGNTKWAGMFFPFIFAGNGPRDGDGYFAFWPLGGRIRNLFGLEQYDFFLWPLFMRTQMAITEDSVSWTVLLLGGWTTGGPRDGSWRALPFYRRALVRHADGTLRTDLTTVLWPFFTWGYSYGDEGGGQRTGMWPLYSQVEGKTFYKRTILWPFFRFNASTDPTPDEGGDFLIDAPWPIFRTSRDIQQRVFRIFPLWSHQVSDNMDSIAYLIPLGWWRNSKGTTLEEGFPPRIYRREDRHFVPVWHNMRRYVDGREGFDRQFQLWPLYHWDGAANGRRDTAFFSFMFLRNTEFFRPADELYSFLWTLWRYQSDGIRDETRLLFDTCMYRTGPEGVRVSIPFLYSQRPEPDGVQLHQWLWGIVGRRADHQGTVSLSILGLDVWQR